MRCDDSPTPESPLYDRPSDLWLCGRCDPAGPCAAGPDADGRCALRLRDCQPGRTWTGRRRTTRNLALCLGFGLLLIAIGSPWRREFLAPGPLAEPHAQILSGAMRNDRCAACHGAARGGLSQWFGTGAAGHAGVSQSQLCMECHHAVIDPNLAMWAHNLGGPQLQAITASLRPTDAAGLPRVPQPAFGLDDVQCSACHREHKGKSADLSWMSNTQCQSCHTNRFTSLAHGHPEWDAWPYGRGGQIAFDHASHRSKHFVQQGQSFDCRGCHEVPSDGNVARAGSFEMTCAACHQKPLELTISGGVELVTLPVLDAQSVRTAGIDLGPWPDGADGVEPFQIAPLTRLLVSASPDVADAILALEDPGANIWTGTPSPQRLTDTRTVASAVRELTERLAVDLQGEMDRRVGAPGIARIVGQLSPQMVAGASTNWFPKDSAASATPEPVTRFEADTMLPRGGWYRDDFRLTLRYRAIEHADAVLRGMVEVAADERLTVGQRATLASIPAVQACIDCHPSVRPDDSTSWLAVRADATERTFTKFSHRPHMNIHNLADCTHCHQVADGTVDIGRNPMPGHGFAPLAKSTCVTCHTADAAGDACMKCHNYHVDSVTF